MAEDNNDKDHRLLLTLTTAATTSTQFRFRPILISQHDHNLLNDPSLRIVPQTQRPMTTPAGNIDDPQPHDDKNGLTMAAPTDYLF